MVASLPSVVSALVKATTSMPASTIFLTAATISLVSPEAEAVITMESLLRCLLPSTSNSAAFTKKASSSGAYLSTK